MVKRIGGARRKTRGIFSKNVRRKGKISLSKYFQELEKGSTVVLKAEPAVAKGLYYRRFHGKHGVIQNKIGSCYSVELKDQGKAKRVTIHPVHLTKIK
jgi:large subunit ribosomal protein L21e